MGWKDAVEQFVKARLTHGPVSKDVAETAVQMWSQENLGTDIPPAVMDQLETAFTYISGGNPNVHTVDWSRFAKDISGDRLPSDDEVVGWVDEQLANNKGTVSWGAIKD